jgi:alkanesulfonate monooxygenase SsuD/methylene tetrahydromethanopterin reductase-like flavin-dependent oxidoreductase (luciferase family)
VPDTGRLGVLLGSWPLGMPEDPRFYPRVSKQVEDAGFDLLFTGDHMFAKGPNPDALALLAACAATTTRVVLGTAILLLPLRDPVVAAKQVATIDLLANGRLALGVGVGGEFDWEWKAMGIPVAGRGERLDEYLALMKQLWSGGTVEHAGPLRPVSGVRGSPAPARPGGPPIWIGGRSDAALSRAARHDGWCAYAVSTKRTRASVERIAELRGGDMRGFRVSAVVFTSVSDDARRARDTAARVLSDRYSQDFDRFLDAFAAVGSLEHVRERIAEFRAAGIDDILLSPQVPAEEFEEQVELLAGLVTPPSSSLPSPGAGRA